MNRAELIAAAEALEWAMEKLPIQGGIYWTCLKDHSKQLRAQAEQASDEQPVSDYLPPLRDFMYHSVRGTEYTFSSGGPHAVFGYLNDECLDDIWECINTAARTGGYLRPSPRESRLEALLREVESAIEKGCVYNLLARIRAELERRHERP